MPELSASLPALIAALQAVLLLMLLIWLVSVFLANVSIIDLFWGPAVATAGTVYWFTAPAPGARGTLILTLAWLWALRLFVYLAARNAGRPEDRRYADMRQRHDPGKAVHVLRPPSEVAVIGERGEHQRRTAAGHPDQEQGLRAGVLDCHGSSLFPAWTGKNRRPGERSGRWARRTCPDDVEWRAN